MDKMARLDRPYWQNLLFALCNSPLPSRGHAVGCVGPTKACVEAILANLCGCTGFSDSSSACTCV